MTTENKKSKRKSPSQQDDLGKLQSAKKGLQKLTSKEKEAIKRVDNPEKVLAEHTKFVRKHLGIVMKVAEKLYYVKENNLFRLKYNTFKEYVNQEFNYTRSRAYQLTAAHEVAAYINKQLEGPILTTEPQCRELSKIKVYTDDDHQKVDYDKSNQKRLELIQNIRKSKDKISTQDIVDAVRAELQKEADSFKQGPASKRYDNSIEKSCENVLKMMENIKEAQDVEADDFKVIKSTMLEKLQNALKQIQEM